MDNTPEQKCNCCPNKIGRGFTEAAFSIGPMTMARCEECKKNECIPFVEVMVDISVGRKSGLLQGNRTPLLRNACTVFKDGKYVKLDDVLKLYADEVEFLIQLGDKKTPFVKPFFEMSGINY